VSEKDRSEYASEEEGAGRATPTLDMIAALALMALAGWYVWVALGFRVPGRWETAPALLPIATGGTLFLMALALGYSAWTRRKVPAEADTAAGREESITDPIRTAILVGVVFVYLLGLDAAPTVYEGWFGRTFVIIGSFEVSTLLVLVVLMRMFWGGALWICTAIALGWTAFLSAVFRYVFMIYLPG
jgi:hypothetical protein